MDESEAREVASLWHGGQSTPLYAFSSSGAIVPGITHEIGDCIDTARIQGMPEEADLLRQLRTYIHSRQED